MYKKTYFNLLTNLLYYYKTTQVTEFYCFEIYEKNIFFFMKLGTIPKVNKD